MFKKDSFIKFMHISASVRETRAVYKQITPQYNSLKTRVIPKLATSYLSQMSNLQTQRILTSQGCLCIAKRNSTVIVIITFKIL